VGGIGRPVVADGPPAAAPLESAPVGPGLDSPKSIDWQEFRRIAGGDAAARSSFERLVGSVVVLTKPGGYQIRGEGGDWGLDVVVGEIIPGETIAVWQAKWFPDHFRAAELLKITESFETAIAKAAEIGYKISVWTLVVPKYLTPTERTKWGKFNREQQKRHGLAIELWEATELEKRLNVREALQLRRIHFGSSETPEPIAIESLSDEAGYDSALFVRQLEAAGIKETRSARQEFFNAEILRREVRNKAVDEEVAELAQRTGEVLAIWEGRFAGAGATEEAARQLYSEVHVALETHHRSTVLRALRASLIHTLGVMHFHVDEGNAGWVRKWREIADAHAS
jgi:hypothetical protein